MSKDNSLPFEFWLFGGAAALVGLATAIIGFVRKANNAGVSRAESDWLSFLPAHFTDLDVEAAARMLASENPKASKRVHVEQIWTQLRSINRGQSLFERITAGLGWGNEGKRPVSSAEKATAEFRELARRVLAGLEPSAIPGARKFFEPAQQDLAFRTAERAREKLRRGQTITAQERRLLGYRFDANGIRNRWGLKNRLGVLDGIEFYG